MKIESKFYEAKNCYVVVTPKTVHYIAMDAKGQWDDNYNYYYDYDYYYDYNYDYYTVLDTRPDYKR